MIKNLNLLWLALVLLMACTNSCSRHRDNSSKLSDKVKPSHLPVSLTDSAKFMQLIDKLPKVKFPEEAAEWSIQEPNIDLAGFKNKKLFKIPFKLNPRNIGGGGIDMGDRDSTFDLCDTNYKAYWEFVAKTPKFIVVEVESGYLKLTTIDYHLKVIDAIHVAAGDPASNNNFQADLNSTIYKDLKVVMHYSYYHRTDEEGNYETEKEDDIWKIDEQGHFKVVEKTNAP